MSQGVSRGNAPHYIWWTGEAVPQILVIVLVRRDSVPPDAEDGEMSTESPMARIAQDPFLILQGRIEAWERCALIPGCDRAVWRQDAAGRVIRWSDFGDRFSRYGWEVASRPRPGVLGRALAAKRLEAVHWRGLTEDTLTVDPFLGRRAA